MTDKEWEEQKEGRKYLSTVIGYLHYGYETYKKAGFNTNDYLFAGTIGDVLLTAPRHAGAIVFCQLRIEFVIPLIQAPVSIDDMRYLCSELTTNEAFEERLRAFATILMASHK